MLLIRSFFNSLNGVHYFECSVCSMPVHYKQREHHICLENSLSLPFAATSLSTKKNSTYFLERSRSRGFLRSLAVWKNSYITGLSLEVEDIEKKEVNESVHGIREGERKEIRFRRGEFISKIKYGCDLHGLYALRFTTTQGRIFEIGTASFYKSIKIPEGKGVVGVFGAYTMVFVHIGFFFDDISEVNFAKNREALLIRYKAQTSEQSPIPRRLDSYLFRYFVQFL